MTEVAGCDHPALATKVPYRFVHRYKITSTLASADVAGTAVSRNPAMFPWMAVEARIQLDSAGPDEKRPRSAFPQLSGPFDCLWRVKDSNLRSFRDGFTARWTCS